VPHQLALLGRVRRRRAIRSVVRQLAGQLSSADGQTMLDGVVLLGAPHLGAAGLELFAQRGVLAAGVSPRHHFN